MSGKERFIHSYILDAYRSNSILYFKNAINEQKRRPVGNDLLDLINI
jgi:hypothetical protein